VIRAAGLADEAAQKHRGCRQDEKIAGQCGDQRERTQPAEKPQRRQVGEDGDAEAEGEDQ